MAARATAFARCALLLTALTLSACLVAAAGAGAGAAVYLTRTGAESLVEGSPDQVAARIPPVFEELNIRQTAVSSEDEGNKRAFRGTAGDLDVTVTLERQSPTTTRVEVTSRKSLVEWDRDFSRQVLAEIVQSK